MLSGHKKLLVIVAIVVVVAAACSSSAKSASPPGTSTAGTSASGKTLTIGVLTDVTGLGSPNNKTLPLGVKAGIGVATKDGYKINYVLADTQSSLTQALSAAQKLVEENHVFAVIADSSFTFAAAPYLLAHGIPVIGASEDASEWITDRNMFSVIGTSNYSNVYSNSGLFYKGVGVTNVASLGYSISPSSSESAKSWALSAEHYGIKTGYLNAQFPFGSTNTGPEVLAMKAAGVNGFDGAIETSTGFAMIQNLRQDGVNLKAAIFATGYGGDLAQGGPAATQIAQGFYFLSSFEPVEMRTSATQQFQTALGTYAGVTAEPTFAEYIGYTSVLALVDGLKAAGSKPTQASLTNALLGMGTFNGGGLYGSHSVGFALDLRGNQSGPDNCWWITRYQGSTFHLVPGMDPLCGAVLPGLKVSASS
jgi:branched-chain amino acid transport system substrate-binding protein